MAGRREGPGAALSQAGDGFWSLASPPSSPLSHDSEDEDEDDAGSLDILMEAPEGFRNSDEECFSESQVGGVGALQRAGEGLVVAAAPPSLRFNRSPAARTSRIRPSWEWPRPRRSPAGTKKQSRPVRPFNSCPY